MTTPKLPPPPRSPQNRSGFSSSDAVDDAPVGGDDLGLDQVVAGEAELALEPAAAAAEREPGDARGRHPAAGDGETVLLRGRVELAPRRAALGVATARSASTLTFFMPRRSTQMPASTTAEPVTPWPPP